MVKPIVLFACALLVLSSVAFWPQYLSRRWAAIDAYTHAHALFGAAWLLSLFAQPLLILRGQRSAHRLVGRASLLVALAFTVSGLLLAQYRLSRMSEETFAKEGVYVYLPLVMALLFALACGLGYRWRRSSAVHARFMASAALLLLDPLVARLMAFHLPPLPSEDLYQGITFTLIAVVLVFLVRSLPPSTQGRASYRKYSFGAVAALALFFVVPHMTLWVVFAHWFRAISLT